MTLPSSSETVGGGATSLSRSSLAILAWSVPGSLLPVAVRREREEGRRGGGEEGKRGEKKVSTSCEKWTLSRAPPAAR